MNPHFASHKKAYKKAAAKAEDTLETLNQKLSETYEKLSRFLEGPSLDDEFEPIHREEEEER